MSSEYLEEIDIARGAAIIGVVIIHTSSLYISLFYNNYLRIINILTRYSVPLFILISGFLHKNVYEKYEKRLAYSKFIVKRFHRIIFPYLSFSILYMIIRIILEKMPNINLFLPIKYNSIKNVLKAIFFIKTNPAAHLYFLPLLFFVVYIFTSLEVMFPQKMKKLLFIICFSISVLAYLFWGDIYLSINPLKGIGFYALGYAIGNSFLYLYNKLIKVNIYSIIFLILFIISILGYVNNSIALIKNVFAYGIHIFGALITFQISFILSKLKFNQFIKSKLIDIGKYSFDIYLLHEPYIVTVIFTILIKLSFINILSNQLIIFVLGLTIPFLLSHLIFRKSKIYRRYFLGLNQ